MVSAAAKLSFASCVPFSANHDDLGRVHSGPPFFQGGQLALRPGTVELQWPVVGALRQILLWAALSSPFQPSTRAVAGCKRQTELKSAQSPPEAWISKRIVRLACRC